MPTCKPKLLEILAANPVAQGMGFFHHFDALVSGACSWNTVEGTTHSVLINCTVPSKNKHGVFCNPCWAAWFHRELKQLERSQGRIVLHFVNGGIGCHTSGQTWDQFQGTSNDEDGLLQWVSGTKAI